MNRLRPRNNGAEFSHGYRNRSTIRPYYMKIVVAPNAFKGSLSALEAARAIRKGVLAACPDCEVIGVPVADGGDGFMEVMHEALRGELCDVTVHGPRMERIRASFSFSRDSGVAIIEMAKASGLALLPEADRDPTETTTLGAGELILAALNSGAAKIIIGLGGSATCDGGIGMAAALGYRFLDRKGYEVFPAGKSLPRIHAIDRSGVDRRICQVAFTGVCDVTNPLHGENGASVVYSPQKGATVQQVQLLDEGLVNLAAIIRRDLGIDVDNLPGAGAAGGLGAGLHSFLGAKLEKGIDIVLDLVGLRQQIHNADLVITGEGRIDYQTTFDKAPAGVARLAREAGVPCVAICGSVGERMHELHAIGLDAVFSICRSPMSLAAAMQHGFDLLACQAEQVVRACLIGQTTGGRAPSVAGDVGKSAVIFTKGF